MSWNLTYSFLIQVARYQVAIDKLKKQTNIDDLDRIVEFYNNFEQENLDLFSKTEQINNDIDAAAQQLRELEKEIERYEEPETQAESEKRGQLANLNVLKSAMKCDADVIFVEISDTGSGSRERVR